MRIAAVDMGSNAIRLIIAESNGKIRVIKKIRQPIRLGADVFSTGEIKSKSFTATVRCFERFKKLMRENGVEHARAVGTSALREARNGKELILEIQHKTGIRIECISGEQEAALVFDAVASRFAIDQHSVLLLDIGGGSIELTYCDHGRVRGQTSFKLGTVRILERLKGTTSIEAAFTSELREIERFLTKYAVPTPEICIATGGNAECLGKLRVSLLQKSSIYSMSIDELFSMYTHLKGMTVKEKVKFLNLKPDRADVIVPAAFIIHEVMIRAQTELLYIPYVGLRDGILNSLAEKSSSSKKRSS